TTGLEKSSLKKDNTKETPNPGTYTLRDFLQESLLNPVRNTYNFKGQGRSKRSLVEPKRDMTLPDVPKYLPPDFVELIKKQMASYSFKDTPRPMPNKLCFKDEVKLSSRLPGRQYNIGPAPVPKFLKEGPGPGHYDVKGSVSRPITSCFQSKVPRFMPLRSKTPGPGTYTAPRQRITQSRSIAKMSREHSLFFNNTIGF
uniref:Sperm-tail PG-rich repeat containing 4 n=1 Tax=Monodelphis domestica TaxID=13616 RepID=F6YRU7_MONDO